MKSAKDAGISTVWDECLNRDRCRFGLRGVVVGLADGEDVVESESWGADGHLMLTTWSGATVRADQAKLRSIWSITCCRPKKRHALNAIDAEVRSRVMARDGYRCVRCDSTAALQIDHIHPVSKGGTDKERNLQTLCRACNLAKSNRVEDES